MEMKAVKKSALIRTVGVIAPRHMKATRDTSNELVAALDRNDSVSIIDSYSSGSHHFTEFEHSDRHLEERRQATGEKVDYVWICSPNYLHDARIRFAPRIDADVICEKPITLNPWNLDALAQVTQLRESLRNFRD
jgi:UDP-N-acetyl-2-amino-2-deoxyglucuronate dehydrogenase